MAVEKYPALVSTEWLAEALKTKTTPEGKPIRVIDCTMVDFSDAGREMHDKQHIPCSTYLDFNLLRDMTSPHFFTVPSAETFAEYIGKTLGITNDAHVVVYENELFYKVMRAPRIWWMFRYFGHGAVSVLDGGLGQWLAEGRPICAQAEPEPKPAPFTVTTKRHNLYTSYEDIVANLKESKFQVMDSRPTEWYDGSWPSVYPGMKLGILKSAIPLPFPTLLQEGTGKFRPADELKAAFESSGIDLTKPLASTCMVGITACILALSAFVAGKEDVSVFDGSWDEFSKKGPEDAATFYDLKPDAAFPDAMMKLMSKH